MKLTDYLLMFVKAYNPNQYERMLERPGSEFFTFFAITITLALVIFTCALVPMTLHYVNTMPERLEPVQQLQLNASVTAPVAVTLLERPTIILDLTANATKKGEVTLTNEGLIYPRYLLFGTGIIKWSDLSDFKQQTPERDRVLGGIVLFLLPSLIFWFFLYSMLKLVLLIIVLSALGYFVPMLFRHRVTFSQTMKVCVLALPSVIIMDFGLYPLATSALTYWGLGLTFVFFVIGIAIMSEVRIDEPIHHKHHDRKP